MLNFLRKKIYKYKLIAELRRELWLTEIDRLHQAAGIVDLEIAAIERKQKVDELEAQLIELQKSHTKEDRETAKTIAQELDLARKRHGMAEQTAKTMTTNQDNKKNHEAYLTGRIKFIKSTM